MMFGSADFINQVSLFFMNFLLVGVLIVALAFLGYLFFQWFKHRKREGYSLDFVTLLVRLPKDNEIKIDAAEQMFAGLHSMKKSGFFSFLKPEELISFEIVALKEEISFYVSCTKKVRDLVEKQIHGAYPFADIKEQDEVNIFNEKGKVEFNYLKFQNAKYLPIKTYKDLPTDGLSLITSAFSKMGNGEGAILQILIHPEGNGWKKKGKKFISNEKKREADPQKATYGHDPKEMEAITTKVEKPGFRVSIRMVVSSQNETTAASHLSNITGAFAQFASAYNKFKKPWFFIKHLFIYIIIITLLSSFSKIIARSIRTKLLQLRCYCNLNCLLPKTLRISPFNLISLYLILFLWSPMHQLRKYSLPITRSRRKSHGVSSLHSLLHKRHIFLKLYGIFNIWSKVHIINTQLTSTLAHRYGLLCLWKLKYMI